ncbi:MAG: hypothetical protein EBX15_01920, partial [Acidimicrobiia bacterium]|nr:hypothetical protein [Acidimicrobiia bacterium]
MRERGWRTLHDACQQLEHTFGMPAVLLDTCQGGEPLQGEGGNRVRRWRGVVDQVFLSHDESLAVVGRRE